MSENNPHNYKLSQNYLLLIRSLHDDHKLSEDVRSEIEEVSNVFLNESHFSYAYTITLLKNYVSLRPCLSTKTNTALSMRFIFLYPSPFCSFVLHACVRIYMRTCM